LPSNKVVAVIRCVAASVIVELFAYDPAFTGGVFVAP